MWTSTDRESHELRRARRANTELYDSDLSWMPPETDDLFLMRLERALLDRIDARIDARLGAVKPPARRRRGRRAALIAASVAALAVALHLVGHTSITNDGPASAEQRIIRDGDVFGRNGLEFYLAKPAPPNAPDAPERPSAIPRPGR